MGRVEGKVVVVTGAAGGRGAADESSHMSGGEIAADGGQTHGGGKLYSDAARGA